MLLEWVVTLKSILQNRTKWVVEGKQVGMAVGLHLICCHCDERLLYVWFWLRTFASKTDKDLWIGTSIAAFVTFAICTLIGTTGFLAVWSGDLTVGDENGYDAFFILLSKMPRWLVAFVLIFCIVLSTCTFDSLQSAMVSTISMMFLETNCTSTM